MSPEKQKLQKKYLLKAVVSKLISYVEAIVFPLLEWIPFLIGRLLRSLIYRIIFAELGASASIPTGVEFVGVERIRIGKFISLHRGVRIRRLNKNSSIDIGDKVTLDKGVDIKANYQEIEIGDHSYLGPYTCLSGGSIKIGKNCLIASHSGIYANNHTFADPLVNIREQKSSFKGIVIEEDCWLGSGVRVVDGVKIGKGSVIGAGAVVTKDIPPYSVAVGVPAKVISKRDKTDKNIEEVKNDLVEIDG
ncbi:MAG: acyltransferase [Okeania sp. SIO2F4]|uniref:acyltransferase n=1 Tax=Okeania sp. SIO2F4 TaxID=2607790 RepID=UPI00142A6B65|nr:acyltransferase [Okeania sp. SIO2F4]NES04238.1 acyltransferase [Okeania sp. SIO2F4]